MIASSRLYEAGIYKRSIELTFGWTQLCSARLGSAWSRPGLGLVWSVWVGRIWGQAADDPIVCNESANPLFVYFMSLQCGVNCSVLLVSEERQQQQQLKHSLRQQIPMATTTTTTMYYNVAGSLLSSWTIG